METHVLFLAMSVLPQISNLIDANTGQIKVGQYRHQDEVIKAPTGAGTLCYSEDVYSGIGQLEPIPQLLNDSYGLTHIIILETSDTNDKIKPEDWNKFRTAYNNQFIHSKPLGEEPLSAVDFFKFRMEQLGIDVSYIDIPVDKNDPAPGIEKMLATIRDLYSRCGTDDWKLWLDTHGGFRDCAMAMFALVQVLAAEDISGIPKLTDAQRLIPVTDVFGIRYRDGTERGDASPIVLQTNFYKNFTGEAFRAYMNYGQYLQSIIESCDPTEEKYTFISYRHGEAEKERVAFLGLMKKTGHAYWYDDGIKIHEDWAETLVQNNRNCTAFALLLSHGYFNSAECLKELRCAIDEKGLDNILVVFLDKQARIDPSCDKKGVASDGKEYTVTADELKRLGSAQQINLTGYSIGDVLQEPHLEKRLSEISFLP